jgi:hypothetical protein
MKRGELSMEVIIVAAIALLVLVIVSFLLIRAGTNTGTGTSCSGVGGSCESDCSSLGEGYTRSGHACGEGLVCCIAVNSQS